MRVDLRSQRPQLGFGDLASQSLFPVLPIGLLLLELQGFKPAADLPGYGAYESDFAVEKMAPARSRSNGEQVGRFSFHPHWSEKFGSSAQPAFHRGGTPADCHANHQDLATVVQLPSHRIIVTQFTNFAAVESRREMIDFDGRDRNHAGVFQFQRFADKSRDRLKNSF